jgi:hypothetical protein
MARLALTLAILASACALAAAKEKPEYKWSCKGNQISFKAKLAGANTPSGKQYPAGTLELCLLPGSGTTPPSMTWKQ